MCTVLVLSFLKATVTVLAKSRKFYSKVHSRTRHNTQHHTIHKWCCCLYCLIKYCVGLDALKTFQRKSKSPFSLLCWFSLLYSVECLKQPALNHTIFIHPTIHLSIHAVLFAYNYIYRLCSMLYSVHEIYVLYTLFQQ